MLMYNMTSNLQEELSTSSFWSIFVGVLFAKCLQYKPVKKGEIWKPSCGCFAEQVFSLYPLHHTTLELTEHE